ncbi:MAG: type II toxin-antitoxin system PemK/MazF family toxin [Alphaproteobacteria bacterium]|nr:type II toxin-antitoxin system PemK/MazF family toxin [Alphaproteobacteria bacterium]
MNRGDIWTVSGGGTYVAKPRPVVIIQDQSFAATESITICPLTSDPTLLPLFRVEVTPSEENGLISASRVMADKITTVAKAKLGRRIGRLSLVDVQRLDRAIMVFLGLTRSSGSGLSPSPPFP